MADTNADLIDRILAAHARLAHLGEAVADEWQYIQDLRAAWGARIDEVRAARGREPAPLAAAAAVEHLVAEAALIADLHRAIDWLSTLPQAALLALGERTP